MNYNMKLYHKKSNLYHIRQKYYFQYHIDKLKDFEHKNNYFLN
jgi:hypothetical protein